jgi:hypothetical protein
MRAVVCTCRRHDLAAQAVASLRRHASGLSSVVVLDASGAMESCDGADEVRHVAFPRHGGAFAATRTFPGEPLLCIDDDVVLLRPIDVQARYPAGRSKPLNGHMVWVVRPGSEGRVRLRQVRLGRGGKAGGYPWSEAAERHGCEVIDDVWLHIDRGSTGENSSRQAVENALSCAPGTELKALLKTIGITASPTCSCNKRAKVMDEKGCDWCEEHIDEIDSWLAEEAKKRKLPYISLAGKTLIRLAIRKARKKGNSR